MKEVTAAEASDSDSGQASEEEDKEDDGNKAACRKLAGRPINGVSRLNVPSVENDLTYCVAVSSVSSHSQMMKVNDSV